MKHIEIDGHFIKEKLDDSLIVTAHIPPGLKVVDIFTKELPSARFQDLIGKHDLYPLKEISVIV
ncbi:Copia protein, partial [Mucuna pruriens]